MNSSKVRRIKCNVGFQKGYLILNDQTFKGIILKLESGDFKYHALSHSEYGISEYFNNLDKAISSLIDSPY